MIIPKGWELVLQLSIITLAVKELIDSLNNSLECR